MSHESLSNFLSFMIDRDYPKKCHGLRMVVLGGGVGVGHDLEKI